MSRLVKEPLDYLCGMSDSQLFEVVSASSRGLSMRSSKSGRLWCQGSYPVETWIRASTLSRKTSFLHLGRNNRDKGPKVSFLHKVMYRCRMCWLRLWVVLWMSPRQGTLSGWGQEPRKILWGIYTLMTLDPSSPTSQWKCLTWIPSSRMFLRKLGLCSQGCSRKILGALDIRKKSVIRRIGPFVRPNKGKSCENRKSRGPLATSKLAKQKDWILGKGCKAQQGPKTPILLRSSKKVNLVPYASSDK